MIDKNLHENAHLMVSAVRVLEYKKGRPPTVDEVCEMLSISLEQGFLLARKISDLEIIEVVEGTYGTRIFIRDYLKIEEIPKNTKDAGLQEAIKKFQDSRKDMENKVASIQANRAEKKKNLFAELEKKLKKNLEKK